jgi:SMI1/KNR4 family protein SUKH-1
VAVTEWRQLLSAHDGYELRPGATGDEVVAAEAVLGAMFPAQLREIYLVTNGVFDRPGQWFVIWPLPEVAARNREAWSLTDSPVRRGLVGFGDDGTGAPFCVLRDGGDGVFAWSMVGGEATLLAETVAGFWSKWTAGTLAPH